ncbi:hypothetical protein DQ04_11881010 [Trypanosoma grayi]|uniref:hypothetical protein n=1 Tax=Trypanosoma grayi TaxID=71804 RepID=UPI0004F43FAF|nr:hypothetical protein DQ04_11881010 [Trypanosoma grayi]KEG06863.1 hypothetical protein DQ04_11881010 [Trypanosoma grayi]
MMMVRLVFLLLDLSLCCACGCVAAAADSRARRAAAVSGGPAAQQEVRASYFRRSTSHPRLTGAGAVALSAGIVGEQVTYSDDLTECMSTANPPEDCVRVVTLDDPLHTPEDNIYAPPPRRPSSKVLGGSTPGPQAAMQQTASQSRKVNLAVAAVPRSNTLQEGGQGHTKCTEEPGQERTDPSSSQCPPEVEKETEPEVKAPDDVHVQNNDLQHPAKEEHLVVEKKTDVRASLEPSGPRQVNSQLPTDEQRTLAAREGEGQLPANPSEMISEHFKSTEEKLSTQRSTSSSDSKDNPQALTGVSSDTSTQTHRTSTPQTTPDVSAADEEPTNKSTLPAAKEPLTAASTAVPGALDTSAEQPSESEALATVAAAASPRPKSDTTNSNGDEVPGKTNMDGVSGSAQLCVPLVLLALLVCLSQY